MAYSHMYSLENPQIWIVVQRKGLERAVPSLCCGASRRQPKWDPSGAGMGLEQEQGQSASQPKPSHLAFPFCLLFQGLQASHKYQSYASQTPRGINHLKDELIISELLRHAEGQAAKFSLHSGEVFLWLGDQVDDKFRSPQGCR